MGWAKFRKVYSVAYIGLQFIFFLLCYQVTIFAVLCYQELKWFKQIYFE